MKRIAVIGTGYWGGNLVRVFGELGALAVICDRDAATVARLREAHPGARGESDPAAVLADESIDAVVIATPAELHHTMVRDAILAGKDVLVEKPLALSAAEGAELVRLAEENGRILMVGHLLWYHPAVLRLKELVDSGELGRIRYLYSNRLNLGKIRREENILWSFAPHDLSVILGLVGEAPSSVQAQGGNYLHERIADVTVTLLSFPSGVKAHVFVSWLHPFKEQKLVIVGEKKMAVFDDVAPWGSKLVLYPHSIEWHGAVPVASKAEAQSVSLEQAEPLKAECSHFLDCLETRRAPRTDGREGLRVLQVLNTCQEAMEERRQVAFPPDGPAPPPVSDWFAHETAVVDEGVEIGPGTKIWHFSHIISGSRIGARCSIGQNVVIGPRAVIGDGCKIQNNVSVFEGVTLEDEVFCGPSMVFTNVVNPRAFIVRKSEYRPTLVRRGATIGANAVVVCGHSIGRWAFVGAGAVVTRDIPDYALVAGNPARQIGWACRCGVRLTHSPGDPGETSCAACGLTYRSDGRTLTETGTGEKR
jgi:UDP-2-acetamido-3-amino-2,3-dideoxy-glucuronate N-acetyltransferase